MNGQELVADRRTSDHDVDVRRRRRLITRRDGQVPTLGSLGIFRIWERIDESVLFTRRVVTHDWTLRYWEDVQPNSPAFDVQNWSLFLR